MLAPSAASTAAATFCRELGYSHRVSPTVRVRSSRAHVHVQNADGETKFWIEPAVELFANYGLKAQQITEAQGLVEEHINDIRRAWAKHFPR